MGHRSNLVDHTCIPINLVKRFTDKYKIPVFIETGTAGGESVMSVSSLFEECHTIELIKDRPLVDVLNKFPNIKLHFGSSTEALPQILSNYNKDLAIFFWLDAHYSDPTPNITGFRECPVLDEIRCLGEFQRSVVLIDDARLFMGPPPAPCDPREWPSIDEIFYELRYQFPHHAITVLDDYIIAVNLHFKEALEAEWRENYSIRFPSEADRIKRATREVVEAFKKYIQ